MSRKKSQLQLKLVEQLQEAKIGDLDRLEAIKKSLIEGKELPEDEVQYLEEASVQLQKAFENQMMSHWAADIVRKLPENEMSQNLSVDNPTRLQGQEKKTFNMDQKLLEESHTKLKQVLAHQKRVNWTLDLIAQLKESKVGDKHKLAQIAKLLKSGNSVDNNHRQYLIENQRHLKQVVGYKTKATWSIEAIERLQQVEIRHSKKLKTIRHEVEKGIIISEHEQQYLDTRYEKLKREIDEQDRIEWTIRTVDKLRRSGLGDNAKLDSIERLLADEIPVSKNDIIYLKEQHKMLRQKSHYKRKLELIIRLIDDLLENKIGSADRLTAIKKSIQERKPLEENEITYLEHKCKVMDIINKNSAIESQIEEKHKDEIDYNFVLNGLNEAIMK